MSQGKLVGSDAEMLRGQVEDKYVNISRFLSIWRILSIISAIGLIGMVDAIDSQFGFVPSLIFFITGLIYIWFFYSIVSFVKPLVDVAVNSYVSGELLKENTEYLRQLVDIEKYKLKNSRQNPSE